jgi:hypothetical protein
MMEKVRRGIIRLTVVRRKKGRRVVDSEAEEDNELNEGDEKEEEEDDRGKGELRVHKPKDSPTEILKKLKVCDRVCSGECLTSGGVEQEGPTIRGDGHKVL